MKGVGESGIDYDRFTILAASWPQAATLWRRVISVVPQSGTW
jgi:hypothetical protein